LLMTSSCSLSSKSISSVVGFRWWPLLVFFLLSLFHQWQEFCWWTLLVLF
jgi:hypothetical protein